MSRPPRLARWSDIAHRWLLDAPGGQAESCVRSLLIQYFFHTSDKAAIEITGLGPQQPARLNLLAPVSFKGRGRIRLDATTLLGWAASPFNHRCSYVEARNPGAVIAVGARTTINNAAVLVAEGEGIVIGADCLIGTELQVFDTNAHELHPAQRRQADRRTRRVTVGDNVFIGSRVTLLKGVTLGQGCVVAAGSVVPPGFTAPALAIVAGNPARVVGRVDAAPVQPTADPTAA